MKNIVAIKTNCYKGYTLDQTIEGIKKAGFKYIELVASPNNSNGISRFVPFNELCDIREKINKSGLIPIGLGGHTNIMELDLTNDLIHNIELARFFNCKYFVCSVADENASDEQVINRLNYFLPYLEKNNITLVIELHGSHCTAKMLNNIVRSVNSKYVRINYDTSNAIFYGGFDDKQLLKDIEEHVDLIDYFHLKDKLGEKNEWNFPALGKGYIPFKEIFDIINKYNSDSLLCAEIEFTSAGTKNVEEVDQAVLDSANYLRQNGFTL